MKRFLWLAAACIPLQAYGQVMDYKGCNDEEKTKLEPAVGQAKGRIYQSIDQLNNLKPGRDDGKTDDGTADISRRLQVAEIGKKIFGPDFVKYNFDTYTDTLSDMRTSLMPPLKIRCVPSTEAANKYIKDHPPSTDADKSEQRKILKRAQHCQGRAGYVRMCDPLAPYYSSPQADADGEECEPGKPIYVCDPFFDGSAEQRIRTIIHESAHKGGGKSEYQPGSTESFESYCAQYTCNMTCGSGVLDVADNWSHFVHCVSGQTPDKEDSISAKP